MVQSTSIGATSHTWVEVRLEAKKACAFLCQLVNTDIMKEARVYGCLRVSILLMVKSILNKNKNKNKYG